MKKQTIKLNESKLRNIIKESVKKVLSESGIDWDALEQDGYLDDMSKLDRLQDPEVMSQYASFDDEEDDKAEINEYDIQMDKLVREYKAKIDTLPKAQGYRNDECNTWLSGVVSSVGTHDSEIARNFSVGSPVTVRIGFPAIDYPESQDGTLYYDLGMQHEKVEPLWYELYVYMYNEKTHATIPNDILITTINAFDEARKEIRFYEFGSALSSRMPALVVSFNNAQQQQPIGGLQESKLRNIIKESVKKVLNEDGDIYYQHENADDMLDQIYNILEKKYGSEASNVGICQALWLLIHDGSNEMRFLANQYIEKNGGIEGVIKHDLLSYQIEHIKPYVGSLKDLYDYPPEPNGWYQGEPYFGKFPGKIEGEFASY